jgi:hypothetical protein
VEHTGRNSLKILLAISVRKRSLERSRSIWEDNIIKDSQAQGMRSSLNG